MQAFETLTGRALVLAQENIDTDQIIPARFLTTTRFEGLGQFVFSDWRFDKQGRARADCPLNEARAPDSPILVAGHNFGCGSSREHAPHALLDFGFRVVISSEIADIFRNNAQNIGLLPITLPLEQHRQLLQMDGQEIRVDLRAGLVTVAGGAQNFPFQIDTFARHCLLRGMDRLDFLIQQGEAIQRFEASR